VFKIRIILLMLVAVFLISATASAVASAQEGPVWHVNGKKLGAKETRAIVDRNEAKNVSKLAGEIAGAKVVVLCKTLTSKGTLVGGSIGGGEDEILFENCELEGIPSCEVKVNPTRTSVMLDHVVGSAKMLVDFFRPSGEVFTEISIKNKEGKVCLPKITNAPVQVGAGDKYAVACEIEPEGSEAALGKVICPEKPYTEVEQEGKVDTVGLEFDHSRATFSTKAEVELLSKEKFGVFQT
jgi:hypothetical protein